MTAIALFSVVYFVQTLLQAAQKRFWFDELCTYYICRLPTFSQSWAAVMHGADFNPALFYWIERVNAALFGFGPVGFRIPQILSFWVLCCCLFWVGRRAAGLLVGCAAMLFPFLTGAHYYAFEARPHGLVLAFAGLAVCCWVCLLEKPSSRIWLTAFSLCLAGAFFLHCYALTLAIPFALLGLMRDIRFRTCHWSFWAALLLPALAAAVSFVPLLGAFRSYIQNTDFTSFFAPVLSQFPAFYQSLFRPCLFVILLGALALILAPADPSPQGAGMKQSVQRRCLLTLAVAFLGLPFYGILLGKLAHGPFFGRYFMSAVIGPAILIGFAADRWRHGRAGVLIVTLLVVAMLWNTAHVIWQSSRAGREALIEPSVEYAIDTSTGNGLSTYPLLESAPPALAVATPGNLDFVYLAHYWTAGRTRLFQVVTSRDTVAFRTTAGLVAYCHLGVNQPLTYDEFLASHKDFLLYSSQKGYYPLLAELIRKGARVNSLRFDAQGSFLANLHFPRNAIAASPAK